MLPNPRRTQFCSSPTRGPTACWGAWANFSTRRRSWQLAIADVRTHFARAWGWEGMWNTTLAVMDAVIGGKRPSIALKLWARHLLDVRERVVLENHISRLTAPVWSLPVGDMPRAIACALRYTATPEHDEDWMTQLRRSCLAITHAFRPQSEHERSLAWIGPRTTPRRPRSMRVRRQRGL